MKNPIFTITIRNKQGTDITGTNTMFERVETGVVEAGESRIVTYTQRIDLQGGDYLISLGCTGYVGDEFRVYHRLYDLVGMTVLSDKDTVGFLGYEFRQSLLKRRERRNTCRNRLEK